MNAAARATNYTHRRSPLFPRFIALSHRATFPSRPPKQLSYIELSITATVDSVVDGKACSLEIYPSYCNLPLSLVTLLSRETNISMRSWDVHRNI